MANSFSISIVSLREVSIELNVSTNFPISSCLWCEIWESSLPAVTFFAAFLLFQIELIVAKILLPLFGGSFSVWGACVVFFQAVLLFGYIFAHLLIKKFGIFRYRYIHLLISFLPFLLFPGKPLSIAPLHYQLPMAIEIFGQLTLSIGLVFFVLSTMSIVWQSWLGENHCRKI